MSERKEQIILENLKNLFNQIYWKEKNESYRDLFREAFSDDYPEEANPDGPVSLNELQTIAKNLNVGPGKTFVDLGCGRGGPGLWIARETGANYIGIDFAENAIEGAKHRTKNFKIKGTFKFQVGDMYSLNLP